jgi:hypothetical protein
MVKIPIHALDDDGVQVRSYEIDGKEYPDSTPLELPIGAARPPTLETYIKNMIQSQLSDVAQAGGAETFEEAGDFDIEDDPVDPRTPWEALFDPVPQPDKEAGGTGPIPSTGTVSGDSSSEAALSSSAQTPRSGASSSVSGSPSGATPEPGQSPENKRGT